MTSTKSPLAGMPATEDAWKAHMKTETKKDSIDLDRADRLGFDKDTVDRLHAADTNKDGRLDWDEAWKAFDDFDSNGDSGSVDLAKLGKKDSALAFARGLTTLSAANDKVAGLRTTKGFDPTQAHSYSVGGRTVKFPPDALAKKAEVDTDYLDRPEIRFQLADGTDGRLYQDPKQGWVAVVDGQHFPVEVGERGDIEIRGALKDDAKAGVVEGHALELRTGDGDWKTVANGRAKSVALDAGTVLIDRGDRNPKFEVTDGARLEAAWIGDGETNREYTFHFRDGQQVGLRWQGSTKYQVRGEGGTWGRLQVPKDRLAYDKLEIQADGTIRAEVEGHSAWGAKVDVFDKTGKLVRTLDFSDDKSRDALKEEGADQVAKGDAAGIGLVNKAYTEQIDHALFVGRNNLTKVSKEQYLAGGYGKRMGAAVAKLAASGKVDEAKALQKKVLDQLYADDSAFSDPDARRLALSAYSKALIEQGEPVASALLPGLEAEVRAKAGDPSRLYLSKETYDALDGLAQAQLKAGKLDVAKALYETASSANTGGHIKLLPGYRSGDAYKVTTQGGTQIGLNDPPSGHRVKTYEGMKTDPGDVAKTKAEQIGLSQTFQKEAAKLPGLSLTSDELTAVPPSPETMKKYFAAKYDGKMPAEMEAMRQELDAYMKVAYAHPQLNVPDSVKGWSAAGLPTMADGRIAADCFCTNRAVAHMLSGVSGLKVHAVLNDGHSRLAVTSADGKSGFVQSNNSTAKLEGSGSLEDKVAYTVSKSDGLQVNYGMPAPIRLGASFDTGSALADVDAAFDAGFADAKQKLDSVDTSTADGKSMVGGRKVKETIAKYEAFRTKAERFAKKWHETPQGEITDAMRKEKEALKTELEALDKEVSALRGDLPSSLRRFVDAQKKNGGVFDTGTGGEWLAGGPLMFVNGQTGLGLSGSGW